MKVDLDKLEAIARAADKDNPGVCHNADHVDGYPSAQSAMDLFNAMDPATTMSLIRRIRELEQVLRDIVGNYTFLGPAINPLLEKGAVQYGRYPVGNDDRWDIDRLNEGDRKEWRR